ncbi:gastrula zinc finger protein XlCGF62.1-like [Ruditapes philippinarum]|uniref:gastrula zinc finger protein XlCGF62.1-like n=1 Tax=Ruditapes philippinarum TaxID=129788 RepID=UPI00295BF221|nr:gastrula zinc finger protein XlCGF62.1-like [Ruditapes philippinarum]
MINKGDHMNIFCCSIKSCRKAFGSKQGMERHVLTHTKERPFQYVVGIDQSENRIYQTSQSERRIQVGQLESSNSNFEQQPYLELLHDGMKILVCQFENCGKTFAAKHMMVRHLRVHTKEKPFICVYCGFQCTRKDNLRQHIRCKHEQFLLQMNSDQETKLA